MKEFRYTNTAVPIFACSMMLLGSIVLLLNFGPLAASVLLTWKGATGLLAFLLGFVLLPISLILHSLNFKIVYLAEEGLLYQTNLLGRRTKSFPLSEIQTVKVSKVANEERLREDSAETTFVTVKRQKGSLHFTSNITNFEMLLHLAQTHSQQDQTLQDA